MGSRPCKSKTLTLVTWDIVSRSSYDTSASFLLNRLHWDNLSTRQKKLKAMLMFKTIKGLAPAYLQNLFSIRSTPYNLRDSEIKLDLPKPRTNYRKRSFGYSGALLWNMYVCILYWKTKHMFHKNAYCLKFPTWTEKQARNIGVERLSKPLLKHTRTSLCRATKEWWFWMSYMKRPIERTIKSLTDILLANKK